MAEESSKGEVQALLSNVFDNGLEDWVHMIEVTWIVRRHTGLTSDDGIRELALEVLEEGICTGLLEMGDVTAEAGFSRWSIEPSEAVARLRRRWPPGMPELDMWGIGWARNTATGGSRRCRSSDRAAAMTPSGGTPVALESRHRIATVQSYPVAHDRHEGPHPARQVRRRVAF